MEDYNKNTKEENKHWLVDMIPMKFQTIKDCEHCIIATCGLLLFMSIIYPTF